LKELWTKVDGWFEAMHAPDPAMADALATNAQHGLPAIDVAPNQARFLHILARAVSAKAILEIGTLGGFSTIALARALPPGGRLVTLEIDESYAQVARTNLARAGVLERVDLRVAPALDTLRTLDGPFDFTFIDADKQNYPEYFMHAKRLSRPGALIVLDNVVREGAVIDPASTDPKVPGTRAVHELLADEPGITWTTLQTVGVKKHDGFTIVLVDSSL
jgi:predicted O-methyltransferase YrrM